MESLQQNIRLEKDILVLDWKIITKTEMKPIEDNKHNEKELSGKFHKLCYNKFEKLF